MSTVTIRTAGEPETWWRRINKSDLVVTGVLLVVFIAAFVMATAWKPLAAYFPLGVSGAGVIASATFLVRVAFFPRAKEAPKTNVPDGTKSMSEQEFDFFKSLSLLDWAKSLGWLAGFFVFLAVFGIYVAVVAFTLAYLRFQAEKSWLFAAVYTTMLAGAIYGIFEVALKLPLPGGLFGLA